MKQKKPAAILGNGPSLRGFDFATSLRGYTTFGMNNAFRYWDRIHWYPDYYACTDINVGLSLLPDIARLVMNAEYYGIQGFLLQDIVVDRLGDASASPRIIRMSSLYRVYPDLFRTFWITCGSQTTLWATTLGFDTLILLGIDLSHTPLNQIKEAKRLDWNRYLMTGTPAHSEDYFFDGYRQEGDVTSEPDPCIDRGLPTHLNAWKNVTIPLVSLDTIIVNASPSSKLSLYTRLEFSKALSVAHQEQNRRKTERKVFGRTASRIAAAPMDELRILYPFLPPAEGTMLEIGAENTTHFFRFLQRGWRIWVAQPDIGFMPHFLNLEQQFTNLIFLQRAFRETSDMKRPFFIHSQIPGLGSLHALTRQYHQNGVVLDMTVAAFQEAYNVPRLDLLYVSANGYEPLILQGLPQEKAKPSHIVVEYANELTLPIGYSAADMANHLTLAGYTVFCSQWHPCRQMKKTSWHSFMPWPTRLCGKYSRGKLLAFATSPEASKLALAVDWARRAAAGPCTPPLPQCLHH